MSKKNIIISCLLSIVIIVLYMVNEIYSTNYKEAISAYRVYLDGEAIGLIEDKDELYNLINDKQQGIKDKYQVDYVYPPDGLDVIETKTFDNDYVSVNDIYQKIESMDDFTIKGYIVTIKPNEGDDILINILNKDLFEEALNKFILAFVSESDLKKYMDGETEDITEIGSIIQNMYFDETITIKEGYISVNDKIYDNVDELSQYLLFGPDAKMDSYEVKVGDSIDAISDKFKLNPQEFIIANPIYRDVSTMLKVGEKVNVTLLDPVLTFVYEVYKIDETETPYGTDKTVDSSKSSDYYEITKAGITGLTLNYEKYKVTNGEQSSQIDILNSVVVREVQNEKVTTGPKRVYTPVTGTYQDIGGDWGWPTNQPSIITSKFGYRWGKLHGGMDISGTGYGSPVYAIADGTVVTTAKACKSCAQWANGTYVVVEHADGYYSSYLHLSGYNVNVGDVVKKGQRIASMGDSGYVTGVHLHLGFSKGYPANDNLMDPLKTIYKGIS